MDDEAYADILMILNNLNAAKKIYNEDNFGSDSSASDFNANDYPVGEIFPSYTVPVIESDGVKPVKWGFPHWKNSSVIINARSETAAEKNMFRKPMRERRCVVPSGGFYEWSRTGGSQRTGSGNYRGGGSGRKLKDKYLFRQPGEHMMYMAGIISTFRDESGDEYNAFVILTTAANDSVAPIHDRMPVLLAKDEHELWIKDERFMYYTIKRTWQDLSPIMV
ncbi:MAG: SOS response-associated peptidase [Oscillospiraceae bacterium]|nr:SOS response-associated peptidase [Oscillospiraceae bacterium]